MNPASMKRRRRRGALVVLRAAVVLAACALFMTRGAYAQLPPTIDPGALQRQNHEAIESLDKSVEPAQPPPPPITGASIGRRLKAIFFGPSSVLGGDELKALAAPLLGQAVDGALLERLTASVNRLYLEKHVEGHAEIATESTADSIVRVQLIEPGQQKAAILPKGTEAWPSDARVDFVLRGVTFGESRLLESAQLDAVVKPYLDQHADLASLQDLVASINQLYAERSASHAHAELPMQVVADGQIRIDLVEPVAQAEASFKGSPPQAVAILQRVDFDASTIFARDELAALADPYLLHAANARTLEELVKQVNDAYAQKRAVQAHAELASWDIRTGVARIRLYEHGPAAAMATVPEGVTGVSPQAAQPAQTSPEVADASRAPVAAGPATLQRVTFTASYILGQNELQALAKPFIGLPADEALPQTIVGKVNQLYAQHKALSARAEVLEWRPQTAALDVRLLEPGSPAAFSVGGGSSPMDGGTLVAPVPEKGGATSGAIGTGSDNPAAADQKKKLLRIVLFSESHVLSSQQLKDVAQPFIGLEATGELLKKLVDATSSLYGSRQPLDHAELLKWEPDTGTAHILLKEPQAAALIVDADGSREFTPSTENETREEENEKDRDQVAFILQRVDFNKSGVLTEDELQEIVKPYLNQKAHLKTLRYIIALINQRYREKGVVTARATLPRQVIQNGVVRIDLVEGQVGKMSVTKVDHLRERYILDRSGQQKGQPVDSQKLAEKLMFLNRSEPVQVQASLLPGEERGQTDIVFSVKEPPRLGGEVFVDDAGSDSTSRYRAGATVRAFNLIGIMDRYDAYATYSRGAIDGYVSASIPVNLWNGRAGLSYSRAHTNIVSGPFEALDLAGESSTLRADFIQPLIATSRWQVTAGGAFSRIDSNTDSGGIELSKILVSEYELNAGITHFGPGYQVSLTQKLVPLHSNETISGNKNFVTYSGTLTWLQRLGNNWFSLMSLSGQWASNSALPSVSLFQLGGVGSVRGYQPGIVAGPNGYSANVELHRRITDSSDAYVFADNGMVLSNFPKIESVTGLGLGGNWRPLPWLSLSADAASALNKKVPDQDNYRVDFRVSAHWGDR